MFDFRQKGEQSWDIELVTTDGRLTLSRGGAGLPSMERSSLWTKPGRRYIRGCMRASRHSVSAAPPRWTGGRSQLVADAFLVGERRIVAPHEI
jgi:D-galactose 1-dehydrogenase/L-arabinose 1- dehydrogenase